MIVEVGSKTDISGMKVTVYPPGYVIGNPYNWRSGTKKRPRRKLYYWFMNSETGELLYFEDGMISMGDQYKTVHVRQDGCGFPTDTESKRSG